MSDIQVFEGDLLLEDSPDFGEIKIINGIILSDRSFNTAVYLSLFGGNKEDSGKVKNNKTWWGNTLPGITESEKMISRFQHIVLGLPMTSRNIQKAEDAAVKDLEWMVAEGMAGKINASGNAMGKNKFELKIEIIAEGVTIYDNTFSMLWRSGIHGSSIRQ